MSHATYSSCRLVTDQSPNLKGICIDVASTEDIDTGHHDRVKATLLCDACRFLICNCPIRHYTQLDFDQRGKHMP